MSLPIERVREELAFCMPDDVASITFSAPFDMIGAMSECVRAMLQAGGVHECDIPGCDCIAMSVEAVAPVAFNVVMKQHLEHGDMC